MVTHVLVVAAGEFGDPVVYVVLLEAGDVLIHVFNVWANRRIAACRNAYG
jgi:hypothetical protein